MSTVLVILAIGGWVLAVFGWIAYYGCDDKRIAAERRANREQAFRVCAEAALTAAHRKVHPATRETFPARLGVVRGEGR